MADQQQPGQNSWRLVIFTASVGAIGAISASVLGSVWNTDTNIAVLRDEIQSNKIEIRGLQRHDAADDLESQRLQQEIAAKLSEFRKELRQAHQLLQVEIQRAKSSENRLDGKVITDILHRICTLERRVAESRCSAEKTTAFPDSQRTTDNPPATQKVSNQIVPRTNTDAWTSACIVAMAIAAAGCIGYVIVTELRRLKNS